MDRGPLLTGVLGCLVVCVAGLACVAALVVVGPTLTIPAELAPFLGYLPVAIALGGIVAGTLAYLWARLADKF